MDFIFKFKFDLAIVGLQAAWADLANPVQVSGYAAICNAALNLPLAPGKTLLNIPVARRGWVLGLSHDDGHAQMPKATRPEVILGVGDGEQGQCCRSWASNVPLLEDLISAVCACVDSRSLCPTPNDRRRATLNCRGLGFATAAVVQAPNPAHLFHNDRV